MGEEEDRVMTSQAFFVCVLCWVFLMFCFFFFFPKGKHCSLFLPCQSHVISTYCAQRVFTVM